VPKQHLLNRWVLTVAVKTDGRKAPHTKISDHASESEAREAYGSFLKALKPGQKVEYANLASPITSGMLGKKPEQMIRLDLEEKKK